MAATDPNESRDTPEALPALARDLSVIASSGPPTPVAIDRELRSEITRHFRSSAPRRRFAARPALAAAAVLGLAASVWYFGPWTGTAQMTATAPPRPATSDLADIDRNGRVDILDALALARRLEDGSAIEPGLDMNGDGGVDRLDVDAIAARAVSLNGRAG